LNANILRHPGNNEYYVRYRDKKGSPNLRESHLLS
jgi:hypothetical protein